LLVPNLSIRDPDSNAGKIPEDKPARKTILYEERVRNTPHSTLSVPLRSATRSIPAAVDARFRGRNVYAIVIPIENMPVYSGDWIVWFAERDPHPGETPLMYAPMPFRKLEVIEEAGAAGNRLRQRIQVAAIVSKDGKLSNVALVTNASPAVERAATQDVASWEFKPATRNGVPIDVEVVVEIPFNLPSPTASNPSP
jgi:TonB family protein